MLGQPLERLPAQIESGEIGIRRLDPRHQPKRMAIVVEPASISQRRRQCILSGMPEWRVAKVVGQAQRLGQILVEPQRARHRSPNLRDFDRMGQPNTEMVAVGGDEHLGFVAQAAEGDRVDDPVPIALEGVARTARAVDALGEGPAARSVRLRGEVP